MRGYPWPVRLVAFAAMLAALTAVGQARAGTGMFVGAAEDNVRSLDPVAANADVQELAITPRELLLAEDA